MENMFPRYCQYVPVKMQVNQTEAALAINNCQRTKLFIGPYCRWEAGGTGVSRALFAKSRGRHYFFSKKRGNMDNLSWSLSDIFQSTLAQERKDDEVNQN